MLPDGFEYGWAAGEEDQWCIHKVGVVGRMLCGRRIGRIPGVQPECPSRRHQQCLDVMFRLPGRGDAAVPEYGTCPSCLGELPLVGGKVAPHREWGPHGVKVGGPQCDGAGQLPVQP